MTTLGILGGMGPLATALFLEQIVTYTKANNDQGHIDTIVYNMPSIPERTGFILGTSDINPAPVLQKHVVALKEQGVSYIAIPCNTAMHFYNDIANLGVEVSNISKIALQATKPTQKVGIMATTGTVSSGIFQRFAKELGRELVFADDKYQKTLMDVIYTAVKAGKPIDQKAFMGIVTHLKEKGSDAIILGCTELTVVNKQLKLDPSFFIDASIELAKEAIQKMGKEVRASV